MEHQLITRRAAFASIGGLVSAAALAVPVATAANPPAEETVGDRLQRFLDTASVEAVIDYHFIQLATALHRKHGTGLWTGIHMERTDLFLVVRHPGDGVLIKYDHDN